MPPTGQGVVVVVVLVVVVVGFVVDGVDGVVLAVDGGSALTVGGAVLGGAVLGEAVLGGAVLGGALLAAVVVGGAVLGAGGAVDGLRSPAIIPVTAVDGAGAAVVVAFDVGAGGAGDCVCGGGEGFGEGAGEDFGGLGGYSSLLDELLFSMMYFMILMNPPGDPYGGGP